MKTGPIYDSKNFFS